jgi:serine/threonine protein kinase
MDEITSNRLERIKELFAAAAEMSPPDRSSFLPGVCDGDSALLAEVERLLREHDEMGSFLESGSGSAGLARLVDLHSFTVGELVSGRFRVVRFIGRGGMGEVYEAEDLELGRNIALKTIRPEIAADERVIARFKQEIQLSLRVTHSNVCRIFDIERHQTASGSQDDAQEVTYLSMELLAGETLAERLRRGRMTTDEALPILLQIIDGLQAAHGAGIVHGDLKSSNVVLIPSNAGTARAVVTDFGLARRGLVLRPRTKPLARPGGPERLHIWRRSRWSAQRSRRQQTSTLSGS